MVSWRITSLSRGWARPLPCWRSKSRSIPPVISPSLDGGCPSGGWSSPRSREPRSASLRRRSWRALIRSLWARVASRSLAIDWLSWAPRSSFSAAAMVSGFVHSSSGTGAAVAREAPPPSGTTKASTRRTWPVAGWANTLASSGVSGRLASRPPSATQWLRVMFAYAAMSGCSGIPDVAPTLELIGTNDGSNAPGKDALLRAARARAVNSGSFSAGAQRIFVEGEQPVMIDIGHQGAVIIGKPAGLTGHHRGGDEYGGADRVLGPGSARAVRRGP